VPVAKKLILRLIKAKSNVLPIAMGVTLILGTNIAMSPLAIADETSGNSQILSMATAKLSQIEAEDAMAHSSAALSMASAAPKAANASEVPVKTVAAPPLTSASSATAAASTLPAPIVVASSESKSSALHEIPPSSPPALASSPAAVTSSTVAPPVADAPVAAPTATDSDTSTPTADNKASDTDDKETSDKAADDKATGDKTSDDTASEDKKDEATAADQKAALDTNDGEGAEGKAVTDTPPTPASMTSTSDLVTGTVPLSGAVSDTSTEAKSAVTDAPIASKNAYGESADANNAQKASMTEAAGLPVTDAKAALPNTAPTKPDLSAHTDVFAQPKPASAAETAPVAPMTAVDTGAVRPEQARAWAEELQLLERENQALRAKLHLNEADPLADIKVDAVTQIREDVLRARVVELEKELDKLHMKHDPGDLPQKTKEPSRPSASLDNTTTTTLTPPLNHDEPAIESIP
jgi:hypothetical protein